MAVLVGREEQAELVVLEVLVGVALSLSLGPIPTQGRSS